MGHGQISLTQGRSVVIPSDFVANHFEHDLPVPGQGLHWHANGADGVMWYSVNPSNGVYNWTDLDACVAAWGGAPWTYEIWGTPTWASARPTESNGQLSLSKPLGCRAEPASQTHLTDFVTALVSRYPTLAAIEFWNEPDIPSTQTPNYSTMTAAAYVQCLQTVYNAAKAVRPAVKILAPGTVYYIDSLGVLDGFFAAGMANYVDAYSIHAYQMQYGTPLKSFLGVAHSLQYFHRARSKAGAPQKDIYITETGQINPIPPNVSDADLVAGFWRGLIAAAATGCKYSAWFVYDGATFGYKTRPAMVAAMEQACALLPGATLTDAVLNLPEQTVSCKINGVTYNW